MRLADVWIRWQPASIRSNSDQSIWSRIVVAGLIVLLLLAPLIYLTSAKPRRSQLDLLTYYYAGRVYNAGGNPYNLAAVQQASGDQVEHAFVYPPSVLPVFGLMARADPNTVSWLFPTVKAVTLLGLIGVWSWWIQRQNQVVFLLFAAVAFNAAIFVDFFVGNISVFEQALIWAGFTLLLRNRPNWFVVLILCSALFKLVPLALLAALPLLRTKRGWGRALLGVFAMAAVQLVSFLTNPQLYLEFLSGLGGFDEGGAINPSLPAFLHDAIQPLVQSTQATALLGAVAYVAIALAVVVLTLRWFRRNHVQDRHAEAELAIPALCVIYVMLAPRMKAYSYIIMILPAFILLIRSASQRNPDVRGAKWKELLVLTVFACASSISLFTYGRVSFATQLLGYTPLFATASVWLRLISQRNKTVFAPVSVASAPFAGHTP